MMIDNDDEYDNNNNNGDNDDDDGRRPLKRHKGIIDGDSDDDDIYGNGVGGGALVVASMNNNDYNSNRNNDDDDDDNERIIRSSSLPSPTLSLTGHKGSIYSLKYSPNGEVLCSTSFDMKCLLWDHSNGYNNFNTLTGHSNAVLDCTWCDNETVATVSADKTVQLWDITTGQRLRKWTGHKGIVNTCSTAPLSNNNNNSCINLVATGSDDTTCCIWDRRQKNPVTVFETSYPVLAVAISSFDVSNPQVFTAGIENIITAWDIRMERKVYGMKGHSEPITSLTVHPIHQMYLLSNSMDQTLRIWDIQPFVASAAKKNNNNKNRHIKTISGHKHSSERGLLKCCWSHHTTDTAQMISAGSADRMVHVWDEYSAEELYLLPGHKGCVNTVTFHPTEHNVIASGGSDNIIYVGELS